MILRQWEYWEELSYVQNLAIFMKQLSSCYFVKLSKNVYGIDLF